MVINRIRFIEYKSPQDIHLSAYPLYYVLGLSIVQNPFVMILIQLLFVIKSRSMAKIFMLAQSSLDNFK